MSDSSENRLAKIEWFIRESYWPCSSCSWVTCEVLSFIIKQSEIESAKDLTDGSRSTSEDECSMCSKHLAICWHFQKYICICVCSSCCTRLGCCVILITLMRSYIAINALLRHDMINNMSWLYSTRICFCGPPTAISVRAPVFTDCCEISLQIALMVFSAH